MLKHALLAGALGLGLLTPGLSATRIPVPAVEAYTVERAYMALPIGALPMDPSVRRRSILEKESDLDFLRFRWTENGQEGWGDVKLLAGTDDTQYIGLTLNVCPDGGCHGELKILKLQADEWTDVTSQFAPKLDLKALGQLVRQVEAIAPLVKKDGSFPYAYRFWQGSNLEITLKPDKNSENGHVIAQYVWNGHGFELTDR